MEIKDIADLLLQSTATVTSWHRLGDAVRQCIADDTDSVLWPYVYAFQYYFVEDSDSEQKSRYGDYAPFIELPGGKVFPPPLFSLEDSVFSEWGSLLAVTDEPLINSRIGDLLWVMRWGEQSYQYARKAMNAYIDIAKNRTDWNDLDRTFCLTRALTLSKNINDKESLDQIIRMIYDACSISLEASDLKPGVTFRLLDPLVDLRKEVRPNLSTLVEKALEVYEGDSWNIEYFLQIKAKLTGYDEERILIYQQVIALWESEFEKASGIAKIYHLQRAINLSRDYGFSEKVEELRKKLQELPEEVLELKELTITTELDSGLIEKIFRQYLEVDTWQEAFSRFGFFGPPCGNYEENLQNIEKQLQESPLPFLVTTVIYDNNNVPVFQGDDLENNKEIYLVQRENMAINFFAEFAPEILNRIITAFGRPSTEELTEYFTSIIIPPDIAKNIAIAFDWYFSEEYDVSAHLIVPRIEAIVRILVQKLGLAVIREPTKKQYGAVITLGELIRHLDGRMDKSWHRYLKILLVHPMGINLRNRVSHGLLQQVSKKEAALLLQAVCFFRLLQLDKKEAT